MNRTQGLRCRWRTHAVSEDARRARTVLCLRSGGGLRAAGARAPAVPGHVLDEVIVGCVIPARGRGQHRAPDRAASGLRQARAGAYGAAQLRLGPAGRGHGRRAHRARAGASGAGRRHRGHEPRADPVERGHGRLARQDAARASAARPPAGARAIPLRVSEAGLFPAARAHRPAGQAQHGPDRRDRRAPLRPVARAQDVYALQSHRRLAAAFDAGDMRAEVATFTTRTNMYTRKTPACGATPISSGWRSSNRCSTGSTVR